MIYRITKADKKRTFLFSFKTRELFFSFYIFMHILGNDRKGTLYLEYSWIGVKVYAICVYNFMVNCEIWYFRLVFLEVQSANPLNVLIGVLMDTWRPHVYNYHTKVYGCICHLIIKKKKKNTTYKALHLMQTRSYFYTLLFINFFLSPFLFMIPTSQKIM